VLVSSYISPKAVKGQPSGIAGRGLIAVAPVAKDEIVAIKGGHLVDAATLDALPERLRNSDVQVADGFHLVALDEAEYEPVMLFINHSCEPNVGFAGNIVLVAMRDVAAGEELTTDYALFAATGSCRSCSAGTAAISPGTCCAASLTRGRRRAPGFRPPSERPRVLHALGCHPDGGGNGVAFCWQTVPAAGSAPVSR
jgi:hypothetical protein